MGLDTQNIPDSHLSSVMCHHPRPDLPPPSPLDQASSLLIASLIQSDLGIASSLNKRLLTTYYLPNTKLGMGYTDKY